LVFFSLNEFFSDSLHLDLKTLYPIGACIVVSQFFMAPPTQAQTQAATSPTATLNIHVCGECHGETGAPKDAKLPIIWGQSAAYLEKQLRDYRSGQRENQIMNSMAESVPKKELSLLAQALASQPWPQPKLSDNSAQSWSSATQADAQFCLTCHAQNTSGESLYKGAPRLNGQNADYLLDQMMAWVNQDRSNSEVMGPLLKNKKKEQLQALSLYFANH
jgi:cytochrome c553